MLNIQIPLILGQLVNIVARYMREHAGNYVHEIRGPAVKLLGLYGIQVSCIVYSLYLTFNKPQLGSDILQLNIWDCCVCDIVKHVCKTCCKTCHY